MARFTFLVDGFNLFHALDFFPGGPDHFRYHRYKWISLRKLAMLFVPAKDSLEQVVYFTTVATWEPSKVIRHKMFIRAQEDEGVRVIYGEFKRRTRECQLCHKQFATFEEKQTDVNIAIELFRLAVLNAFDSAVIVSGDTDLLPAIRAVRSTFPGKHIGVLLPIARASEDMKKNSDFYFRMKEKHLKTSRLADSHALRDGTVLHCPPKWR